MWFYIFLGLKLSWKNIFSLLREIKVIRLVHSGCIYFHIFIIIDNKISFYHIYHVYWVLFIVSLLNSTCVVPGFRISSLPCVALFLPNSVLSREFFFYYLQINSTQGLQRVGRHLFWPYAPFSAFYTMFEKDKFAVFIFVFTMIYYKFPSNNFGLLWRTFFQQCSSLISYPSISFSINISCVWKCARLYRFSKEILNKLNQTFVPFYV